MIRNQWYAVLQPDEVKPHKLTAVTRLGEKLLFWRNTQDEIVCMRDGCPHRGVALSAGKLIHDHVQCPFHGFEYDSRGQCTFIPANGKAAHPPKAFKVVTYPTRQAHGFVWIWWGEPLSQQDLPPIPWFDSIDDSFDYATFKDHWATHYSRAIENQLDVVHLPFVHHNTIGRGNRTLVDGPIVEWDERNPNMLNLWVYNRVDDGRPPLRPEEMAKPSRRPFLQFCFPNIWQNWISDEIRIVIAFVPVDDGNTLMYIRYYQKVMKLPLLRHLVNWMGLVGSWVIERQDRRVVVTQQPKRSFLHMGEKLIQGDHPILAYRRRREELIGQAQYPPKNS